MLSLLVFGTNTHVVWRSWCVPAACGRVGDEEVTDGATLPWGTVLWFLCRFVLRVTFLQSVCGVQQRRPVSVLHWSCLDIRHLSASRRGLPLHVFSTLCSQWCRFFFSSCSSEVQTGTHTLAASRFLVVELNQEVMVLCWWSSFQSFPGIF